MTPRYLVQLGRGPKGAYWTRYSTDNATQAALFYRGVNVGYGYKARLLDNGKVVARKAS